MAVAIAVIRGFSRQEKKTIGNFWVDVTRATVYVLLPLSFIAALLFVSQGVVQNFHPYNGRGRQWKAEKQLIAQGPVASQEAIKQLGTNGGGFFNANSAHPFEKSHAAGEPAANVPDLCDPRSAHLHLRKDGRRYAAKAGRFSRPWP